jgi:tetratricopeptide (TPR) repeat protein
MSLKENVDYIKEEISNEEKFFESFFKVEKFYKKYKFIIIALVVLVLGYFITTNILSYVKEQNAIAANKAYNTLLQDPKNKEAMDILKEKNKTLFNIAMYKINKDNTADVDVIYLDNIAKFNKAVANNDIEQLNKLILDPTFVLKDYALFNKALILANNKEYKKAKQTLKDISKDSQVNTLADLLRHYLLTK